MTKLLGTIIGYFMLSSLLAQPAKLLLNTKDSSSKFTDSIRSLPPLEVRSVRANENSPFAKTNLNKDAIAAVNFGQDLPFLLQSTPSVVVHSDAGMSVGYTGIRIRGTDATRINVTLNGIPYNDAESMGTYFVDLPDFGSSIGSVQIQRGVGTSTNGSGAFGATLNLATNSYHPEKYLSIQSSVGSFNSVKNTLNLGTGLLNQHFTLDGRISGITSDGYIDRAKSNLKSFYVSGTYWGDNSSLRFNIFSGWEKTYQAWYGVPEELLSTTRTYNPAGTEKTGTPYQNQTDNYQQTHFQVFYNKQISKKLAWNTAFFLTRGKGYYEEYKAEANLQEYFSTAPKMIQDIVRRKWLDNNFYGQIASLVYEEGKNKIILGGGWNTYDGLHYGRLPYLAIAQVNKESNYYYNNAIKKDFNSYVKWNYQINKSLNSFVDLQYRSVTHNMYGFDHNADLTIKRNFNFINPKAGITYTKNKTTYYSSIAIANKEPNRDDFEAGLTEQPKAESLMDLETGFTTKYAAFEWGANFYWMNYKDQLVLTGKINDVGSYTRVNVPISYRMGIELEQSWKINKQWSNSSNITFSSNKIESFTEYFDDYDNGGQVSILHKNTTISLSPAITAAHILNYSIRPNWKIYVTSKYVGKQYLDNTQNESRILKAYYLQNISTQIQLTQKAKWSAQLQLHANNIFNKLYEPNGYTYSYLYGGTVTTSNNYYPMAGRNYWLSIQIDIK